MIIYALGSAPVTVRRMNRSRSFAVLFDKLSWNIGKVDPNKNLSILIDSYVELHMFLIAEPAGKARQRSSIAKEIW